MSQHHLSHKSALGAHSCFPSAVSGELLLLSQPRPLPIAPPLPWALEELELLHITPVHLSG